MPVGCAGLRVRSFLVAAMEQQMWFFGCDAACADGNLLVRYGFRRYRREDHRGESSCYRLAWHPMADGHGSPALVDLHGWCAGLHPRDAGRGETGFLYVRAGSRVGWYDAPEPPAPGDYDRRSSGRCALHALGRHPEPGFCRAAARFLLWLEEYESWVGASFGPGYRQRCFERAPLPWLPPAEARGWLAHYRQAITLAVQTPGSQPMHQPTLP